MSKIKKRIKHNKLLYIMLSSISIISLLGMLQMRLMKDEVRFYLGVIIFVFSLTMIAMSFLEAQVSDE